jgi:hypothetical protein
MLLGAMQVIDNTDAVLRIVIWLGMLALVIGDFNDPPPITLCGIPLEPNTVSLPSVYCTVHRHNHAGRQHFGWIINSYRYR